MRTSLRLTGLLAALSLVTSVPVTSGFVCERTGGADHMAGMAMGGSSNPGSSVSSGGSVVQEAPVSPAVPCDFPWAPSGCHSMIPCSPNAIATESAVVPEIAPAQFRVASTHVLTPPSETKLPELPPPRA
jgi:hypothetical protein